MTNRIAAFSVIAFVAGGCAASDAAQPGSKDAAAPTPGLEQVCGPAFKGKRLPAGTLEDAKKALEAYRGKDAADIKAAVSRDGVTEQEFSAALYHLAIAELKAKHDAEALALLQLAADELLQPVAMVKLSQIYYHGGAALEFKDGKPAQDLAKSNLYVSQAMVIAGMVEKQHGGKFLLDRVVTGGLGVVDGLHMQAVAGKFDEKAEAERVAPRLEAAAKAYRKRYLEP